MECKYPYIHRYKLRGPELIDTLWNVNVHVPVAVGKGKELIDTLWNVNAVCSCSLFRPTSN